MSECDSPVKRDGDQQMWASDGIAFDEVPQFDPDRGVVYPVAADPVAETRSASQGDVPQAVPPLELDGQAAAHAFAASRHLRQPSGESEGPLLGDAVPERPTRSPSRWKAALVLSAVLAVAIAGALSFAAGRSQSGRALATSPSLSDTALGEPLADIQAQGHRLQEKAVAGFEATRRGIEGLTSAPLLIIESTPSGAEIWIDGEWLGNTPFAGDNRHAKGAHEIRLRLKGYREATLEIQGGESSRLNVVLRRR